MRFHGGMAVGHLPTQQPESLHPGDPVTPMDVDMPYSDPHPEPFMDTALVEVEESDEESTGEGSGEESDYSERGIPEPDSEEEPDIYE